MSNYVELPDWINEASVERAYGRAKEAQHQHDETLAQVGMRAAMARDPRMLMALDKGAEILAAIVERQWGRHQRDPSTSYGEKAELTELGLWRNAYEQTDKKVNENTEERYYALFPFRWILACAAELAGLRP